MSETCPPLPMTTIWYSYLAMYIYWRVLVGCALKYSPYFRSLDRTKQLKAVAYVADLSIRLPAFICAGYLLAMGYMSTFFLVGGMFFW